MVRLLESCWVQYEVTEELLACGGGDRGLANVIYATLFGESLNWLLYGRSTPVSALKRCTAETNARSNEQGQKTI